MKITKLKGGSLSSTSLYSGDDIFVRKEINRNINREYGYIRWASQLKKMQQLGSLFPDLFPKILNVSCTENIAYFDMEYMHSFSDLKSLFSKSELSSKLISRINKTLWDAFDRIHSGTYNTVSNMPSLYFMEEVQQKITDAKVSPDFTKFFEYGVYKYNEQYISGIDTYIDRLADSFNNAILPHEEYIHGNPTLENILYSVEKDRIVFIDVYDESIIDTRYLDYSQILQCSNSYYGYINDRQINVYNNSVSHELIIPENFKIFNRYFVQALNDRNVNMNFINILEATQFIRMLPFKCLAGDIDKAKFFYVHACYLLNKIYKNE